MIVSCVIPALNEGARLPAFLQDLGRQLSAPPTVEPTMDVIVVDDGSDTNHLEKHREAVERLANALAQGPHRARLHALQSNRGKAEAIRIGWSEARSDADWIGFVDADGAVPAREVVRLARMLPSFMFDVLAGSRIRLAGHVIRRSAFRHFQGRVFATAVEWLFALGFYDPQCGLKFFRASALRPQLSALRERTWLLDIEVLALVRREGSEMREEPIDWSDPGGSKMIFGIDAARMLVGLWNLRRRIDARRSLGS
jgi:dolichyl-phosphate beta-glucosyltransferase